MWWLVLIFCGISGIICWIALSKKWLTATDNNNYFNLQLINMLRVFHPILPGAHQGFMDLKWTIVRHGVIGILSAVLAWYINVSFIEILLVVLNLFYAITVVSRYRKRSDELSDIWYEEKRIGDADHLNTQTARPLVEASKIPAIYAVLVYVAIQLMLIYKWFII